MRILDGHIHVREERDEYSKFRKELAASDVSGGIVLSLPPAGYLGCEETQTAENRMQGVLRCTNGHPDLHPFFWIDPVGREAAGDVALAIDAGARGFKVICSTFSHADPLALDTPGHSKIRPYGAHPWHAHQVHPVRRAFCPHGRS